MSLPSIHEDSSESTWITRIAIIVLPVAVGLVMAFQVFVGDLYGRTREKPPPEVVAAENGEPGQLSPLVVQSKLYVKVRAALSAHGTTEPWREQLAEMDELAVTRADRLRLAIVAAEIVGVPEAVSRLRSLRAEATPGQDLANEAGWLIRMYEAHGSRTPKPIPPEVLTAMRARHGWFADLAGTFGTTESNSIRWQVVQGGRSLMFFGAGMGLLMLVTSGLGLVCSIVFMTKLRSGELETRLQEPRAPSGAYLEAFAIWTLGFFLVLAVRVLVLGQTGVWSVVMTELMLWGLLLCLLWPIARGVSWSDLRADLGLTTGRGVGREILCGVIGFLAVMPLEWMGRRIAGIVEQLTGGESQPPRGVPAFETPLADSWALVWLGAVGSVLWAPVVEEVLFRGCLYRFVRSRLTWGWTAVVTAIIFGIIHPYSAAGIITVAFGGIGLALIKEWRGCLIAPIVAHALHNAIIETNVIGFLMIID